MLTNSACNKQVYIAIIIYISIEHTQGSSICTIYGIIAPTTRAFYIIIWIQSTHSKDINIILY